MANIFTAKQVPIKSIFHLFAPPSKAHLVMDHWAIWAGLYMTSSKVQLQIVHTLCALYMYVKRLPYGGYLHMYIVWRADQVLYGSYPYIGLRMFVQNHKMKHE